MENAFNFNSNQAGTDLTTLAQGTAFESVASHLGRFVQIGRALEARVVLTEERIRGLERELKEAHTLFDRMMKDEKNKNTEAAVELAKMRSQLQAQKEAEQLLRMQFSSLGAEFQKRSGELKQYQERWSQILQREAEAKALLAEHDRAQAHLREVERRLSEAEKTIADERELRRKAREQTAAYRSELESAVKTVDTLLASRSSSQTVVRSERAQAKPQAKKENHQAVARESDSRPESTKRSGGAVTIKPGMSWMAPRASHDDNPEKMFEAELASWRESPLAPDR